MLIKFDDNSAFAEGAAGYNTLPGYEMSEYVVIQVEIGPANGLREAVIDTSSPYLILTTDIAKSIGLDLDAPEASGRAHVQGQLMEGKIYVINMSLLADEHYGKSVQDDVWAFVPDTDPPFDPYPLPPTVIGFKRCLDMFLFAVDPYRQRFYFG